MNRGQYKLTLDNKLVVFNKLGCILYSAGFHLFYDINLFVGVNKLVDHERISFPNKCINNPKFLFVSMYASKFEKIGFGIYDGNHKYKWIFANNCIFNLHTKMYLNIVNNALVLSYKKTKWNFVNDLIQHSKTQLYISVNYNYHIEFTKDITEASKFYIEGETIHFVKPHLLICFEINNYKQRLNIPHFIHRFNSTICLDKQYNVGILLAAGTSSRFQSTKQKQLYVLNGRPIITFSIDAMIHALDKLIIVTNDTCYDEIAKIVQEDSKIVLLRNNINCRLESIGVAHKYIKNSNMHLSNIVIHDSARPFITDDHITTLLKLNVTYAYSQYSIKLVNGLIKSKPTYEFVNRDEYIEACSPVCINYNAFDFIFVHYISKPNRITHEFYSIIQLLHLKHVFVDGLHKHLKKITTIDDVDV